MAVRLQALATLYGIPAATAALATLLVSGGSAAAVSAGPAMVAHRAIYELTLDQDNSSDTVARCGRAHGL